MASYKVVTEFQATSGDPTDSVVSTLHFADDNVSMDEDVAHALAGHVAAAYAVDAGYSGGVCLAKFLSQELSRVELPVSRVYDEDGGAPFTEDVWAGFPAGLVPPALPSEVAICLSFRSNYADAVEFGPDVDDDGFPDTRPRARRRGRIFVGPLIRDATVITGASPARVEPNFRTVLLDFAQKLWTMPAGILTDEAAGWAVYSKTDGIPRPVAFASVDNAFDTQRRRGRVATVKEEIDLGA